MRRPALPAPAALALVALLAGPTAAINLFQYKTETSKGAACGMENKPVGPFYIPDSQCSGVLYDLARHCERLELVKVAVTDYAHVKVTIDDSLNSASIERVPNLSRECPGRAMVHAVLGCAPSSGESPALDPQLYASRVLPPE